MDAEVQIPWLNQIKTTGNFSSLKIKALLVVISPVDSNAGGKTTNNSGLLVLINYIDLDVTSHITY